MTSLDFLALMKAEKLKYRNNLKGATSVSSCSSIASNSHSADTSSPLPPAPEAHAHAHAHAHTVADTRSFDLKQPTESISDFHLSDYFVADTLVIPPSLFYIPDFISVEDEEWLLSHIYNRSNASDWVSLRTRRLQCYRNDNSSISEENVRTSTSIPNPNRTCSAEKPFPPYLAHFISAINTSPMIQAVRSYCSSAASAAVTISGAGGDIDTDDKSAVSPASLMMNHVLVNEYQRGQGILHHTDGPKYVPLVLIISLESSVVMTFKRRLRSHEIGGGSSEEATGVSRDEVVVDSAIDAHRVGDKGTCSNNSNSSINSDVVFSVLLQPRSAFVFSNDAYSCYLHGIDETDHDVISPGLRDKGCESSVYGYCINKHLCVLPSGGSTGGSSGVGVGSSSSGSSGCAGSSSSSSSGGSVATPGVTVNHDDVNPDGAINVRSRRISMTIRHSFAPMGL